MTDIIWKVIPMVISLFALCFSFWQFHNNKNLNLYDKRRRVYGGVREMIYLPMAKGSIDIEDIMKFESNIEESEFLFGKDIKKYLKEISEYAWEFQVTVSKMDNPLHDDEKGEAINKRTELLLWFGNQREISKEKFIKYLKL